MRATVIAPQLVLDTGRRRPSWTLRARARMLAARFDRELEAGVPVVPGSALALHAHRIASLPERQRLADGLRLILARAHTGDAPMTARIPLCRRQILAEEVLIGEILQRLDRPARGRGVARLRLLLADGAGPLYVTGRGSLAAQLRGVLAAL
ncbi:MAG TPA: hypothetical protein VIU87_25375 [Mycobacterium sp.]